jgi:hypothetical protein
VKSALIVTLVCICMFLLVACGLYLADVIEAYRRGEHLEEDE